MAASAPRHISISTDPRVSATQNAENARDIRQRLEELQTRVDGFNSELEAELTALSERATELETGWQTLYDHDFTADATGTAFDGAGDTAGGLPWGVFNLASADHIQVVVDEGLELDHAAVNTVWDSGSFSAPAAYVNLSDIEGYDPTKTIMVMARLETSAALASGQGFGIGIVDTGSTANVRQNCMTHQYENVAGTLQQHFWEDTAAAIFAGTLTDTVFVLIAEQPGILGNGVAYTGVYSSGMPATTELTPQARFTESGNAVITRITGGLSGNSGILFGAYRSAGNVVVRLKHLTVKQRW